MFKYNHTTVRRVGYIASIGSVALIAAWGSYRHQLDVATIAGQPIEIASTLPLSVDGMLLVASLAMADDKANFRRPRAWARFAFWLGATVSISANIASTVVHHGWNPLSIGVASWAPLALLVVTEIMARPGKVEEDDEADTPEPQAKPRKVVSDREKAARKRAGYAKMSPAEKADWTRRYRERTGSTAPVSPAGPTTGYVPSVDELTTATA